MAAPSTIAASLQMNAPISLFWVHETHATKTALFRSSFSGK
jgi:hypothetical protein